MANDSGQAYLAGLLRAGAKPIAPAAGPARAPAAPSPQPLVPELPAEAVPEDVALTSNEPDREENSPERLNLEAADRVLLPPRGATHADEHDDGQTRAVEPQDEAPSPRRHDASTLPPEAPRQDDDYSDPRPSFEARHEHRGARPTGEGFEEGADFLPERAHATRPARTNVEAPRPEVDDAGEAVPRVSALVEAARAETSLPSAPTSPGNMETRGPEPRAPVERALPVNVRASSDTPERAAVAPETHGREDRTAHAVERDARRAEAEPGRAEGLQARGANADRYTLEGHVAELRALMQSRQKGDTAGTAGPTPHAPPTDVTAGEARPRRDDARAASGAHAPSEAQHPGARVEPPAGNAVALPAHASSHSVAPRAAEAAPTPARPRQVRPPRPADEEPAPQGRPARALQGDGAREIPAAESRAPRLSINRLEVQIVNQPPPPPAPAPPAPPPAPARDAWDGVDRGYLGRFYS